MKYDPKVTSIPGLQANLHNHFVVQGEKSVHRAHRLERFRCTFKNR